MFSVVIPLYNKELSVGSTIQSVLDQTFSDFEIVVVDDGSTDNSVYAVEKFNDNRIRLIRKSNEGVSSTRNRGIVEANREWISFLDADDLWANNHLEVISQMISEFPHAHLFATSFDYSDKRFTKRVQRELRFSVIDNYFKESLVEHMIWTSIFVVQRSCFNESKFPVDLALGEDMILWGDLVKKFTFVKAKDVTATYRIDSENRSNEGKYRMQSSFLARLEFSAMNCPYEKEFYRKIIIQKIKSFLVLKDWRSLFFLLKRYNIDLL